MRARCVASVLVVAVLGAAGCHHRVAPVTAPPPAVPTPPPPAPPPPVQRAAPAVQDEYARLKSMDVAELDRLGLLEDVHFDLDRTDIREADRGILANDGETLRKYDFLQVTVEGHCDERGTVEYNLALGERRARAVRDYLASLGVPAERLRTVSYGKEAPVCTTHDESCWQRNRRGQLRITGKVQGR